MRAVNIYATRTALTEWAGQGYVNSVGGVSLDPRIESFGANTRLAIEVQRFGSYLTTVYAYATGAIRNADTGRDINVGSIVYGETNGPLAFWSGSAWTVDGFSVATALRAALSAFASSLIIADGVPIPGPPGTTDFDDLTSLPTTLAGYGIEDAATEEQGEKADSAIQPTELAEVIVAAPGGKEALEFALETAMPTLKAKVDRAIQPENLSTTEIPAVVTGAVSRSLGSKLGEVKSIEDFGAIGNDADDSAAFTKANTWLAGGFGRSLYVPRYYKSSVTLVLGEAGYVFGDAREISGINWTGGDFPIIARAGYLDSNSAGPSNIYVRDIRVDDNAPTRNNHWSLDFGNSKFCRVELALNVPDPKSKAVGGKFGLIMGRYPGSSYMGETFVASVERSRFSGSKCYINTTDYYASKNEFWAVGRDYSLRVGAGGSVQDNQFVGGQDFGALYIDAPGQSLETMRVVGNYFDGSYNDLDTRSGIKVSAGTRLNRAVISSNVFWHQNREGISCEGVISQSDISGNVFDNCDSADGGFVDIYVATSDNSKYNNQHFRQDIAPKTGATRVNLGRPLVIGATGNPNNTEKVVTSQVDPAFYLDAIYGAGVKVDVICSSRKFGRASGEFLSIYENSVSGNYNLFTASGVFYFSNGPASTNGPSLSAGEFAVKLEVNSLSPGYTIQEITLPKNGKKWIRMEDNSVWSTWLPV